MEKFAISSGHGLYVRGASYYIDEVDEARRVVDQVTELLKSLGCTVHKYHDNVTKTQRDNVNGIVRWHNQQDRDLDISVHFNAAQPTDEPRGTEVYYLTDNAKPYAEKISAAIAQASGLKNRGAKKRTNLGFLNYTHKPAILIEVCFVDSKADVEIYKAKFNEICKAIAEALTGQKIAAKQPEQPAPAKPAAKGNSTIKYIQETLNKRYGLGIAVDGVFGPQTKKAMVKALQTEINKQFGARLTVDGIFGPKAKQACPIVRIGAKGNITWLIQAALYVHGYDPNGIDGIFGKRTANAVLKFQKDHKLIQDAIVGPQTFEKLFD